MRITRLLITFIVALGINEVRAQNQPASTLETLLVAAGDYLEQYSTAVGAIAGEERSFENASISATGGRTVRSDIVLLSVGSASWAAFRDVFEVDGQSTRPRTNRLVDALTGPPGAAIDTARRLNTEGARRHLGAENVNRAINAPMLALIFLARANQSRSEFKFDGMKSVNGVQAGLVIFKERAKPRLLPSADEAAAEGRFWIQPGTGRVVQTELAMRSSGRTPMSDSSVSVSAKVTVRYGDQPSLGLLLPTRLDEEFEISPQAPGVTAGRPSGGISQTITGRANYSNYKKIDLDVRKIAR